MYENNPDLLLIRYEITINSNLSHTFQLLFNSLPTPNRLSKILKNQPYWIPRGVPCIVSPKSTEIISSANVNLSME